MAKAILQRNGKPVKREGKEIYSSEMFGVLKSADVDQRRLIIVGTTEDVDRDGDIILVNGWKIENFLKNPVFLWAHDYRSVPLARAEKVIRRRNPNRYEFHEVFPTVGLYSFADMILNLYSEKIINASSVGFIPLDWEEIEKDDDDDDFKISHRGRKYTLQELLELSGCAVPANPEALQNMISDLTSFVGDKKLAKYLLENNIPPSLRIDDIKGELIGREAVYEEESENFQIQVPEEFNSGEAIEKDDVLKPYPHEHACRLTDPGKYDRFARKNCKQKHDGKCIDVIYGIKNEKTEIQSLRFSKDIWTVAAAKKVCVDRKGEFEPASSEESFAEGQIAGDILLAEVTLGVCGSRTLKTAPEDYAWDAAAADLRIRKWASSDGSGNTDKIAWSKYQKAFCWVNPEDPNKLGSYKMPFVDVIGGDLKAVWKGVSAGMAALMGARGGVDIPDRDRKPVYNFLVVYYKKFDKEPPEYRSFFDLAKEQVLEEEMDKEFIGKEGAVLNRKNKKRLVDAQKLIQEVLEEAGASNEEGTSQDIYGVILGESQEDKPTSKVVGKPQEKHQLDGLTNVIVQLTEELIRLRRR